ncbi:MAG TPA: amidase [Gemmatimonadales bacterium]|jgi:Asp-tRNA(Asn)/Glu-tRNA(Gln) amidotransferase A subunit family amidase|nr:amidase [Gemmatimonadales bacterium]
MVDRRLFLTTCSRFGLGATLFPGALYALAQGQAAVTKDMVLQAATIADVPILPEDVDAMLNTLNNRMAGYDAIYKLGMANSVAPAFDFDPVPSGTRIDTARKPTRMSVPAARGGAVPTNLEELCFATVRDLATLVRTRKVSSVDLTQMYIARLKRLDPQLHCVITITEDRALAQARQADTDLRAGKYHGPLHGLPWGAKDLLAVKGYPTTWGAGGFEHQMIDEDATVVQRLDKAGAVLIAKLTLGALAQGDHWYGGITRNPWNLQQGSSGSSAGPASATGAGCVAFSIGSETLGSISSPSTRCGVTGLRPSFGRVPRTGAMALSWSMDKLGPICRAVEDCALVLDAIQGPDGGDRTARAAAFNWDAQLDWRKLKVGYLKAEFEGGPPRPTTVAPAMPPKPDSELTDVERKARDDQRRRQEMQRQTTQYDRQYNDAALAKLRGMGVKLEEVGLPYDLPWQAMSALLNAEAAAAFDDLTRSGKDKLLTEQGPGDWPNVFRAARFMPAVEYIQANRARMVGIQAMAKIFDQYDVVVTPTFGLQLVITNLTGHPALIVPNGFRGSDAPVFSQEFGGNYGGPGTPVSLTFLGKLYGEASLLALGRAYQEATGFHTKHPSL